MYTYVYVCICMYTCIRLHDVFLLLTGVYKFGVLSSNTSELWISTDEHPVNIRKVACFGCLNQVGFLACTGVHMYIYVCMYVRTYVYICTYTYLRQWALKACP